MPIDSSALLVAVARAIAVEATLRDVVAHLAVVLRDAIPFERLHVLRLDRAESVILYVARSSGELEVTGHRIADRGQTAPGAGDVGAQSRIVCTVARGARVYGAVWCTSSQPNAFTAEHQHVMDSVCDLLGLALQQDAILSTELDRRERLDALERLLQAMAESLDVRHIFAEVSNVI